MTSYPQYAALVPAITDQTEQAKYDLFVYPDPDATYTLKYKYDRFADALSSTLTDVYGSGIHDDTVLYAMLAKWESLIDGNPNGECNQKYRAMRAEFVGRLRTDDSDGPGRLEARDQTTTITFQGSSLD